MIYCARQLSTKNTPFVLGDLKPANILVSKNHVFKISDFGTHVKTEEYESSEQKSHQSLDKRSDIFNGSPETIQDSDSKRTVPSGNGI